MRFFNKRSIVLLIDIVIIFTLVSITTGYEERTGWAWHKKYASDNELFVLDAEQTRDGGYILSGRIKSYPSLQGSGDYLGTFLIKTDGAGNLEWSKQFDVKTLYSLRRIKEASDGGYFLASWYLPEGQFSYSLIKTDSTGNFRWVHQMDDEATNILPTPDGGCIYTKGGPLFINAFELGKIDRDGVVQWTRTYSKPGTFHLRQAILTSDGEVLIGISLGENVTLIKTDSTGRDQWSKVYDFVDLFDIQQKGDGGYSFLFQTYDIQYGLRAGYKVGLAKLDANGNVQETHLVDEYIPDLFPNQLKIRLTPDGGFMFLEGGLYKLDSAGSVESRWDNFHESPDIEQMLQTREVKRTIQGFRPTSDGGIILYGWYHVFSNTTCNARVCETLVYNADAWLIKIDKNNNPSPRTETTDRIFLPSGNLPELPGFDMVISLLGLTIAAIYCTKKYT